MVCVAFPEAFIVGRGLETTARGGAIGQARSRDQSEVEMNVCSTPRQGEVQVWVQVWIWPQALSNLGRLARCQGGVCCARVREEERSSAARPGRG